MDSTSVIPVGVSICPVDILGPRAAMYLPLEYVVAIQSSIDGVVQRGCDQEP